LYISDPGPWLSVDFWPVEQNESMLDTFGAEIEIPAVFILFWVIAGCPAKPTKGQH
jgi:hypothetical protein